jgi:hypothetical protein
MKKTNAVTKSSELNLVLNTHYSSKYSIHQKHRLLALLLEDDLDLSLCDIRLRHLHERHQLVHPVLSFQKYTIRILQTE